MFKIHRASQFAEFWPPEVTIGVSGGEPAATSAMEFKALAPGETRRVLLLHKDRRLGLIMNLVAPEKSGDHPPRSVTLQPCGMVIGRVVNGRRKARRRFAAYGNGSANARF